MFKSAHTHHTQAMFLGLTVYDKLEVVFSVRNFDPASKGAVLLSKQFPVHIPPRPRAHDSHVADLARNVAKGEVHRNHVGHAGLWA